MVRTTLLCSGAQTGIVEVECLYAKKDGGPVETRATKHFAMQSAAIWRTASTAAQRAMTMLKHIASQEAQSVTVEMGAFVTVDFFSL